MDTTATQIIYEEELKRAMTDLLIYGTTYFYGKNFYYSQVDNGFWSKSIMSTQEFQEYYINANGVFEKKVKIIHPCLKDCLKDI